MKSFFAELKRRNVYKVAVAYVVVGWLLIQVATQVFPFFEVPNWGVRLIVLCITLGFPIALILAWAFEITPEGLKRTENITPAGVLDQSSKPLATNEPFAPEKSIALLPFENLSEEKANAYFASGMGDEILTKLAELAQLKVISRTSTERYRGHPHDLREVGRQLGVATLLVGSVQKAGDEVLISVQLIDARSDTQLWAQSYQRTLKNIFDVEAEVAEKVAEALKVKLIPAEAQRLAAPATTNPRAHDLYLRARALGAHSDEQSFVQTIALLRQALIEDPQFAVAWAHLAWAYLLIMDAYRAPLEFLAPAQHAALMAVANDERAAAGHIFLGAISLIFNWDFPVAKRELERGVALDPNSSDARGWHAWYLARVERDFVAARAELEQAQTLDPFYTWQVWAAVTVAIAQGDYEAAMKSAERILTIDPHFLYDEDPIAHVYVAMGRWQDGVKRYESLAASTLGGPNFELAVCYAHTGETTRAKRILNELETRAQHRYVDRTHIAAIHAALGDKDQAFAELDQACRDRSARISAPRFYPWLAPLFDDPRFAALENKVNHSAIAVPADLAMPITSEWMKRTENLSPGEHIPNWSKRKLVALFASVALAAGGLLLLFQLTRSNPAASTATPAEPTPQSNPKSIAVLPFENLSDDQRNAYFAAGIQDDIITALAKISDLKVISRNSTEKYQSQPAELKTVARELGVATVLQGSVQKAGDRARVNVQLIDAQTNAHLWAESYDRQLTDIFAVQRDVAERVTQSLAAKLRPHEAAELAEVPTKSPAAYDLYLRANYVIRQSGLKLVDITPALELYRQAIQIDSSFALAYARLSAAESRMYWWRTDFTVTRLEDAKRNADLALALKPDLAEAHFARAMFLFVGPQDMENTLSELELAVQKQPNNAGFFSLRASVRASRGEWDQYLADGTRAAELDPRGSENFLFLGATYHSLRRYAEAEQAFNRSLALDPENDRARLWQVGLFLTSGNLPAAREGLAAMRDEALTPSLRIGKSFGLGRIAEFSRNFPAAVEAYGKISLGETGFTRAEKDVRLGFVRFYKGEKVEAERAFKDAQVALAGFAAAHPDDPNYLSLAAKIHAGLGQRDQALAAAERAVALMPVSKNQPDGIRNLVGLAETRAFLGEADAALPLIRQLLTMPGAGRDLSPALLRLDPIWDPIRNDPRFQELSAGETKP